MKTVSDHVLARLAAWGVRRIFGYPGDGVNGLFGALNRDAHGITFVQARHEETAGLMATGHAKFTGELGVCVATSGAGAIHLLNGLYDAKMDHQPVVAIVGQAARAAIGGDARDEVDLSNLFRDVAHDYLHEATNPTEVIHLVDRAVRMAKSERTVTAVIIPKDVQEMTAPDAYAERPTLQRELAYAVRHTMPTDTDLGRAATILNCAKRVAILVGAGACGASQEIIDLADATSAGVAKALLGRSVVPDDLSVVTGAIGVLGTKPSADMMRECDALLVVGSGFPYSEFLPREGQAKAVQIDTDPRRIGLRYPVDVGLVGDAKETLRRLIPLLVEKGHTAWRARIEENVRAWWDLLQKRAMVPANPINPERVVWELSAKLPDRAMITADSGSATSWFARDIVLRRGMTASLSSGLSSMGCAIPYALAAKLAHPDRPAVALVGDGAMQMNGNAELITIANHWRRWKDPRLVVLVLNNRALATSTWELRAMEHDAGYDAAQGIPDFPYARYAELVGLAGMRVETPDQLARGFERALSADRPFVLEALVDPEVSPLPPHISLEEAQAFGVATLQAQQTAAEVIREVVEEVFPRL
jgi:pyruvate dehydrogenase (quinone)